jgi:large exoprotein involved in heme utilization and adhesion
LISSTNGNITTSNLSSYSYAPYSNSGNGGSITLSTINGNINTGNLDSDSSAYYFSGNGGNISISSTNGNSNTGILDSYSTAYYFSGNGGIVSLLADGNVSVATINTSSFSSNAGNVSLTSRNGNIDTRNGSINAYSFSGLGGQVTLTTGQDILSGSIDTSSQDSNAGSISINARSIAVTDRAYLFSGTFGQGNAGNISINATDLVSFNNGRIYTGSSGNAGENEGYVRINARSVSFTNGSRISTNPLFSSQGQEANSGNISINAIDLVSFDNSSISSETVFGFGNGGLMNINAHSVSFTNGSGLSSSTFGQGNAGVISITANDSVSFDNFSSAFSEVFPGAVGSGGNVNIKARSVSFTNSSGLSSSTFGLGDSGAISIAATDSVSFDSSFVLSDVLSGAVGKGGKVNVNAHSVSFTNGSELTSSTLGQGNAGVISITATDSVSFDNFSSASSDVLYGAVGNGGKVNVNARSVSFINGSGLSSRTFGQGNAGNIDINAQMLNIQNGGRISTSTSSSGNAGSIKIILGQSLYLDGTGTVITAGTIFGSTGNGGSIFIDPPLVSITNGAGISVNSLGAGNGGNMDIIAGKFIFTNNAFISANTASGEGGNINLQLAEIFFPRNHSSITATAAGTGNGGNITISNPFSFLISIPSENNDIYANAFFGKGGTLNITTQAIFGFQYRPRLTPLSDITASSEYGVQGIVNLNTLDTDPSKGLNNLPVDVSDPSRLVTQHCIADQRGSEFIITGKGGVPANPSDRPTDTGVLDNFGTLPDRNNTTNLTSSAAPQPTSTPDAIVEATGWIVNAQNQVVLVAGKTTAQPNIRCPR